MKGVMREDMGYARSSADRSRAMRWSTITVLSIVCLVLVDSRDAFATSGWDRHSVDIEGDYRIHGANGSTVSRLNSSGNPVEPPLVRFVFVPEYIVTSTHIVLRGYIITESNGAPSSFPSSNEPQLAYVAIHKKDSIVVGPMTGDEFSARSFELAETCRWNRPSTAADSFDRFVYTVLIVVTGFVVPLIATPVILYLALRRRRSQLATTCSTGSLWYER